MKRLLYKTWFRRAFAANYSFGDRIENLFSLFYTQNIKV